VQNKMRLNTTITNPSNPLVVGSYVYFTAQGYIYKYDLNAITSTTASPALSSLPSGSATTIYTMPVMDTAQNVIYTGGNNGVLYAIDPTNLALKWSFDTGKEIPSK